MKNAKPFMVDPANSSDGVMAVLRVLTALHFCAANGETVHCNMGHKYKATEKFPTCTSCCAIKIAFEKLVEINDIMIQNREPEELIRAGLSAKEKAK